MKFWLHTSFALLVGVLFAFAPMGASAHYDEDDGETCHTHEGGEKHHCHFELPVDDGLLEPPHPLLESLNHVIDVVGGVVSVKPESYHNSDFCVDGTDCPNRQRCILGICDEPSFQPLGTLFDSVQFAVRTGGPGAAVRLRW